MVEQHRPGRPARIVVKPARARPSYTRAPCCLWPGCRALLAHDHDSPVCACHVHEYNLRHDKHANELVLHLLLAAYPDAIDLTHTLRAPKDAVRDRVAYLRRRGHLIRGSEHGHGYWYELPQNARRQRTGSRTVKPVKPRKGAP